jgi:hypothetical protein
MDTFCPSLAIDTIGGGLAMRAAMSAVDMVPSGLGPRGPGPATLKGCGWLVLLKPVLSTALSVAM